MLTETQNRLLTKIEQHYASNREPLFLATLGQDISEIRDSLIDTYGSLSKAIISLGGDKAQIINNERPGKVAVVTPEFRSEIEKRLTPVGVAPSSQFDDLPLPIRIAFCLKPESGTRIAIKTSAPIRYIRVNSGEVTPAGYKELDEKFRTPGLHLADASAAEKAKMWRSYLE